VTNPVAQQALDRALDDTEQLLLVYQAIHDAKSSAIYGAEALLRQRRENGEVRSASMITKAAEERGGYELFTLDSLVMQNAYDDASQWPREVHLNVNLSPKEFEDGKVLDRLKPFAEVSKLNLEITETSYIAHPKETEDVLRAIKELGFGLWLDDFGTGHSSITHLQRFPLDGLKLPGAFVKPLPHDPRCLAIVRALIALAHDLGMRVIAEEVEKQEQLDVLLEHGCEYIQGFLFSRPMESEAFASLLERRAS
jgi:EAL domain-containing protein (putative c-di-GMP-specific phosphodiesterase class I)